MDRNKLLEYFDATEVVKHAIHVVGCGAVGSHVAETLARLGCTNIHLWDFDTVSSHNITNQMFTHTDIGLNKTTAVGAMLEAINPQIRLSLHNDGVSEDEVLNGYVFLCVDDIDVRRNIVTANQFNPNCISFVDFRMRLTDAQHYFALRQDASKLLKTMNFTNEEAEVATPRSACNIELNVVYTVKSIVSFGMANWVNTLLGKEAKFMCLVDLEDLSILTM